MSRIVKPSGTELRAFSIDDYEIRAGEPNADGTIPFRGHAAVFNRKADIGGYFTEQFSPGAFKRTIAQADVRMLVNHDPSMPLARSKAGSLRLSEDSKGLAVEADMTPTTYALDLALLMDQRVVSEMSIGFSAVKDEWDESPKIPHRTVIEARLFDVSPVTFPAYGGTDASLRSVQHASLLRALGLDEIDAEQRDALLLSIAIGDVAPEHRAALVAMQERVALLVPAEPRGTDHGDADEHDEPRGADHGESRALTLNLLRRRHRLNAIRLGVA